jgi:peptidoglycan/LPS O-acetylase OafA/YrhL
MSNSKNRLVILDAMRFFAALCVLIYHYSIYLDSKGFLIHISKYGFLGVNFFFLLSGFVIMASAQKRTSFQFAYARALRIYPAFILCLLLTIFFLSSVATNTFSFKEIATNATLLNDYVGIRNIDGVYWTLQAELKFYGCVFLLIFFNLISFWRVWLPTWLFLAVLFFFTKLPSNLGWFINPNYSFFFIGGVSSYLVYKERKSVLAILIFLASLVFASMTSIKQASGFITHVELIDSIIIAIICAGIYLFFFLLSTHKLIPLKMDLWLTLGAMSYPLYLLHNQLGKTVINHLLHLGLDLQTAVPITTTLVLSLSYAVTRFEKWVTPMLRLKLTQ